MIPFTKNELDFVQSLSEGGHCLAVVVGNESLEEGHGSLDPLFRDESHDADHGQPAVVELLNEALRLRLGRFVFGEPEGVEQVQRDGVGDHAVIGEFGVRPRHASPHVVGPRGLGVPFEEPDEEDDLPLGSGGEGIPLLRRRSGREGERATVERDRPGEVESVGLDDVPDERRHGDASVLDLGLPKERDSLVVRVSPDGGGGELEGIVELGTRRKEDEKDEREETRENLGVRKRKTHKKIMDMVVESNLPSTRGWTSRRWTSDRRWQHWSRPRCERTGPGRRPRPIRSTGKRGMASWRQKRVYYCLLLECWDGRVQHALCVHVELGRRKDFFVRDSCSHESEKLFPPPPRLAPSFVFSKNKMYLAGGAAFMDSWLVT